MRQTKVVLTSMLALVIATPSMAAVGDLVTTGASCTIGDLGVSTGTANATAQFEPNTYVCPAGTYLPADATQCTACTAGNFCPGAVDCEDMGECDDPFYTFNEDDDQGLISCEDYAPAGYTSSGASATSSDACYMSVSCPVISGNSACGPHTTGCAYTNPNATSGNIYADGSLTANCGLTYSCAQGYTSQSIDAPTLPSTSTGGNNCQYRSHIQDGSTRNNDNDLSAGEWKVTWNGSGTMKGIASCNAVPGDKSNNWANASTLPANTNLASNSADANDSSRRYCWCKPTSWTASGGTTTELSAAWVFLYDRGGASYCANNCAVYCASYVGDNAGFRSALFGVVGAMTQCVANTIDINWKNENGTVFTTGQCTYDESLTVPSTHPDKRGYTFTGWKFVSPSQN